MDYVTRHPFSFPSFAFPLPFVQAQAQLRMLKQGRAVQAKAERREAASRSDGAREELQQMKQQQVALRRQFKVGDWGWLAGLAGPLLLGLSGCAAWG
jgi:hypothetical protein